MINKKNLLGKTPDVLGDKDAIHVAIVSVRAGRAIEPGQRCGLNADREAVPDRKGCGYADPWRRKTIMRGEAFWMLLNQDEVPNVQHHWEHPTLDFSPPTTAAKRNKWIQQTADEFGVTYEQIMAAAEYVVEHDKPAPYPGEKDLSEIYFDRWEFWSEWAGETLTEFPNYGSECCPEYAYPKCHLFVKV
jgi:hypothetical protein